jgi:hypothetical protein
LLCREPNKTIEFHKTDNRSEPGGYPKKFQTFITGYNSLNKLSNSDSNSAGDQVSIALSFCEQISDFVLINFEIKVSFL